MNPDEVVVHVVDRERCDVILDLFGERVCQPGEAAIAHADSEVLTLNIRSRNVFFVGIPNLRFTMATDALRRAVAARSGISSAVELVQDGVVNIALKGVIDRVEVQLEAVRGKLHAIGETVLKIVHKLMGRLPVAFADKPRANEFGIGVDGYPGPSVASMPLGSKLRCDVLLLRSDKRPDFITLNVLRLEVYQMLVEVVRTGFSKINQQFRNRVFGNSGYPNGRANRIALYQRANHLSLFGLV
jgi:hypothetical protein